VQKISTEILYIYHTGRLLILELRLIFYFAVSQRLAEEGSKLFSLATLGRTLFLLNVKKLLPEQLIAMIEMMYPQIE